MLGSGSVPSSGQQQYSHERMYQPQQDISTPYIPPYRPTPHTGNDSIPIQTEQDQSSGRQHLCSNKMGSFPGLPHYKTMLHLQSTVLH